MTSRSSGLSEIKNRLLATLVLAVTGVCDIILQQRRMRPQLHREELAKIGGELLLLELRRKLAQLAMKLTTGEAVVPLLGAFAPRYVVKQATVKRCVAALLLVSMASIFYYTHYIISSPLSR